MKTFAFLLISILIAQFTCAQDASIPKEVENWLEQELKKANVKELKEFQKDSFFRKDSVKIIGFIKGYDNNGSKNGMIYNENLLTKEDFPTLIRIKPDGRFETKIEINFPIYSYLNLLGQDVKFYAEPGNIVAMIINPKEDKEPVKYLGITKEINDELNSIKTNRPDHETLEGQIKSMKEEDFLKLTKTEWKNEKERVSQLLKKNKISKKAQTIMLNEVDLNFMDRLFNYNMYKEYYAGQDKENKLLQTPTTAEYFNFIQEIDNNDYTYLINREFTFTINRIEYSPFYPRMKYINGPNPYQKIDSVGFTRYKNKELSLFYSIANLRAISSELSKPIYFSDRTEKNIQDIKLNLKHPFLLSELERKINIVKNSADGYDLPKTQSTEIFKKLLEPYKGKIVVVDFWAENCGPCRANIEATLELRKHLKDHPHLEFVFITDKGNTSDTFYKEYIEKNYMTNSFLVSEDDYLAFRELFRFNAIPRYVIVDPNGIIKDDNFAMYNSQYLLNKFYPEKIKLEDFKFNKKDSTDSNVAMNHKKQ